MTNDSDRIRIHELLNWHGHLMDEAEFDWLGDLFRDDVVYDVSALRGSRLIGTRAIVEAGRALGAANPLSHHVTNFVVVEIDDHRARVRSKGLAVMSDGTTDSVVYDDEVRRTGRGWRIAVRRVLPRRAPLQRSGP